MGAGLPAGAWLVKIRGTEGRGAQRLRPSPPRVVVLAAFPAAQLAWWLSPIVLANVLIGLLIAKSLVEYLALTLQYRAARA